MHIGIFPQEDMAAEMPVINKKIPGKSWDMRRQKDNIPEPHSPGKIILYKTKMEKSPELGQGELKARHSPEFLKIKLSLALSVMVKVGRATRTEVSQRLTSPSEETP